MIVSSSEKQGKMRNEEKCKSTRAGIEEDMNEQVIMIMWADYVDRKRRYQ